MTSTTCDFRTYLNNINIICLKKLPLVSPGFASFGQGWFKPWFWAGLNHPAQISAQNYPKPIFAHIFVQNPFWGTHLSKTVQYLFWGTYLSKTYFKAPFCRKLPKTYFEATICPNLNKIYFATYFSKTCFGTPICPKLSKTYFEVHICPKPMFSHLFAQNYPKPI